MEYYLALDAGGSKVHVLLFDSEYNRLDFEVAASANPNLIKKEQIIENMRRTYEVMFAKMPQVKEIACVYATAVCPPDFLVEPLTEFVKVGRVQNIPEGAMGMFANCHSGSAVVALSGTGSDIHLVENGEVHFAIGGWGAIIADEGSGFWIGRKALQASIHYFEGRGEKTMLMDMIADRLIPGDFRSSVFEIYKSSAPARGVAAMSRCVDEAARKGDKVAIDILLSAAQVLCDQVEALYSVHPEARDLPLMVMGGSWKNFLLFDEFSRVVAEQLNGKVVQEPVFEPINGGVFYCMKEHGYSDDDAKAIMLKKFAVDIYPLP